MLVFGVSAVESLGEGVVKSSPWWAAGGRPPWQFLCVCVCVCGWRGRLEHRLARREVKGVEGWQARQKEGLCFADPTL